MRRVLTSIVLFVLMVSTVHAQRFGVTAGTNFQELSDITLNSTQAAFQNQNGWHAGVWLELPMGPLGIRFGGRYMEAGRLFSGLNERFPLVQDDFNISLVELNVLLRYGLQSPLINPYVFAGPVFRIPIGADEGISNDLSALSYAGEIGGGLEIPIGSLALYPEVAYVFGVTRFIEDELVLDFVTLTVEDTQRLNTIILRLSLGF